MSPCRLLPAMTHEVAKDLSKVKPVQALPVRWCEVTFVVADGTTGVCASYQPRSSTRTQRIPCRIVSRGPESQ